jgi:hypothetical protein
MEMSATFDPMRHYRYRLWRRWDANAASIGFVLLNPSTADDTQNDPTIRRCIQFAQTWGYGSLEVVNLFAYRSPTPRALQSSADPVGRDNDRHLLDVARSAHLLVLGWGNHGSLFNRDQAVLARLTELAPLYCLGTTKVGSPRHPLYLHRDSVLTHFTGHALEP